MENGFILPIEKEIFIDQLKDIVDKAEDILSEDMDGEKISDFGKNHLQGQTPGDEGGEVIHGVESLKKKNILKMEFNSLISLNFIILTVSFYCFPGNKWTATWGSPASVSAKW